MISNIGIVLYENVQPMDVIGPWEVFSFWKNILNAPIHMHLISQNGSYVECDNAIILKAHCDFDHAPPIDCLIIPGGRGRRDQVNNKDLISFIKKQSEKCKYILSICTGMFLLYEAGMLNGKSATTYWRALSELKALPGVNVIENRVVKNGNIWTSGGVSSGIDLALELIAEIAGEETAGQVQLLFEYFPKDTVYCTEKTIHTLPPYQRGEPPPCLPEYIQKYMKLRK